MKAIIFARVSTEEQREAGNSLPAQVDRLEKYAQRKSLNVIETYSFDESAYKEKRDEFDKILERINQSQEKLVICFDKVDRLSRNVFDKRVSLLYDKAIEGDIELHFVSDGQVISSYMSAVEKFQFGMSLGLAKYYSDAISDNIKRAHEKMRREGRWPTQPPIGYISTLDSSGNKDMIPDPEKSYLVRRLFKLYATGNYSLTLLHREAIELGLTNRKGAPISRCVLDRILQNPFYHGIAPSKIHGSYPHKYEVIVDHQLFMKCQKIRTGRSHAQTKLATEKPFAFKGLLRCHDCNCSISGDLKVKPNGKEYIYYSCSNAKGNCKREYVNENDLIKQVVGVFEDFKSIPDERVDQIMNGLRKTLEAEKVYHAKQLVRINSELSRVQTSSDSLAEKFINEQVDEETYNRLMSKYKKQRVQLEESLQDHGTADYDFKITLPVIKSLNTRLSDIFKSSKPHEKRAILNYLLSNPTLQQKKLYFTIASPFSELLDSTGSLTWCME